MPVLTLMTRVQILDKLPVGGVLVPPAAPALPAEYLSAGFTTAFWQMTAFDVEDADASLFANAAGGKFAIPWTLMPAGAGADVAPSGPTNLPEVAVLTTATVMSASPTSAKRGILVQAPSTNTIAIYIGGSMVTTGIGIELLPGESIAFGISDASTLYAIAASTLQVARVLVV
jgi:hypothetical protein